MIPTPSDILTIQELHGYLKIPTPTLYALAQHGQIPAAKVGKHWRFRRSEIDDWFKAQQWNRVSKRSTRKHKVTETHA